MRKKSDIYVSVKFHPLSISEGFRVIRTRQTTLWSLIPCRGEFFIFSIKMSRSLQSASSHFTRNAELHYGFASSLRVEEFARNGQIYRSDTPGTSYHALARLAGTQSKYQALRRPTNTHKLIRRNRSNGLSLVRKS